MSTPDHSLSIVPFGNFARAFSVLIVLAICSLVVSSKVAGGLFWALALMGAAFGLRNARALSFHSSSNRLIWLIAIVPVVLNVSSVLWFGLRAREVSWLPFVALPLLVTLIRRFELGPPVLVWGATAACITALVNTTLSLQFFGEARTSLDMNAIVFAQITMALCIVCVWAYAERTRYGLPWLLPIAALAGIGATLMAGFRGGLFALPFMLLALLHPGDARASRRRIRWPTALLVAGLLAAMMVLAGNRLSIVERIGTVWQEVDSYRQGVIRFSSAGSRLALWNAAIELTERHPVFGIGARQFHSGLQQLRDEGRFPVDVELFHHAHNSYLNIAAEYGVIGLATFAIVLWLIWRALGYADPEARWIGRLSLGCWLTFALTNDVLAHQNTLRAMVLTLAICLAASTGDRSLEAKPATPPRGRR
jgi:O-Antigen ligase